MDACFWKALVTVASLRSKSILIFIIVNHKPFFVLSLNLIQENELSDRHDYIMSKIEERKNAKMNKDFSLADNIREELAKEGIILVDTREGTTYKLED